MPAMLFAHSQVISNFITHDTFEGWMRLIYLVPRFMLYFVLSPQAPKILSGEIEQRKLVAKRVFLALLAETICMAFGGWVFGRSIM
jgi:hypothetical protein